MSAGKQGPTGAKTPMPRVLLLCVCIAGFCVSVTVNYPGFMGYDSILQILEARAGIYSDWHPPFMAFIWHFTNRVIPGPFGMLILQTSLVWCGTFLIAAFFFDGAPYPLLALTPCLLVFYPPIFGISGMIWKDILMWGFLALAIGVAGTIRTLSPASACRGIAKLLVGSLVLLAALLCRHNAVFAIIPLITLAVVRSIGPTTSARHLTTTSLIGVLAFAAMLLGATLINNALTTYKTTAWYQPAFFDIAGIIHGLSDAGEQNAIYQRIPARLRGNGSLENLLHTYSPSNWGTMAQIESPAFRPDPSTHHSTSARDDITEQEKNALGRLWLETILHHPFAWFMHRDAVFAEVIGLTHNDLRVPVAMGKPYPDWLATAYGRADPDLNSFQSYVSWRLTNLSRHFIFRPWLYLILSTLVIVACLAFRGPMQTQCALIATSGLAYEASLFFFAPAADFRYSHYMIYTSLLAFLLFVARPLKLQTTREGVEHH